MIKSPFKARIAVYSWAKAVQRMKKPMKKESSGNIKLHLALTLIQNKEYDKKI